MRNRKTIIAFILCACLVVGLGYAALVEQLKVTGTAQFNPSATVLDKAIHFTGKVTTSNPEACSVTVSRGDDSAQMNVIINAGDDAYANVDDGDKDLTQYVITAELEIELDNTNGSETLTVNLGPVDYSGDWGKFAISGVCKDATLTAEAGKTAVTTLTVKVAIDTNTAETIPSTAFTVYLPVTEVVAP